MSELQQPEPAAPGAGPGDAPRVPADVPWGVAGGLAICIAYFALTVLVGQVLAARLPGPGLEHTMVTVVVSGLLVLAMTRGLLQACSGGKAPAHRLVGLVAPGWTGLRRAVKPALLGAMAYAAIAIGWGYVLLRVCHARVPDQPIIGLIRNATSPTEIALAFLGGALVAPLVEEVLFRGMLYLPLRKALGVRWAAVVVGVLFALVHGYGWGFPQLFVLSLIFVALFECTGTLLAPIAAHAAYNAVQITLVLMGWT